MDKESCEKGKGSGEAGDNGAGTDTIAATGDAIIIADAILELADSFRDVAAALRALIPEDKGDDEETPPEHYLDGTPRKK